LDWGREPFVRGDPTNGGKENLMTLPRLASIAAASLLLAPSAGPAQQPAQYVVQVWSFGFAPNPIALPAGKRVTLTFVNRSGSSHDFTAHSFFAHATIISGSVEGGEVDLAPHETKTVTLVPTRGSYHAHCSHFLHKQMGMSDLILVN
jgi:plastocyanin